MSSNDPIEDVQPSTVTTPGDAFEESVITDVEMVSGSTLGRTPDSDDAAVVDQHRTVGAVNATKPTSTDGVGDASNSSFEAEAAAAVAAAQAAEAAASTMQAGSQLATIDETQPHDPTSQDGDNKWSKNGYGNPVSKQSGKFSKEESVLVRKAIEEFCSAKQISIARLCSECDHKAELKGAWMEIAKRLPHRSVQSVYRHGIRQCHPFKRGAWSDAECTMLHDLVQRMGKKWSSIQAKLNRSADSCRDKYREMSDEYIKGRWKDEETELLKKLIRQQLNVAADMDMKVLGKMVEEQDIQIPWSNISKKMGKRSRLSCFKKWQKMTGLFSPADENKRGAKPAASGGTTGAGDSASDDVEPPPKRAKIEANILESSESAANAVLVSAEAAAAAMDAPPTVADTGAGENSDVLELGTPTEGDKDAGSEAPPTVAAGEASAAPTTSRGGGDFDIYSARMAAETVEAVDLPDTIV